MNASKLLFQIESSIKSKSERDYFLTHRSRYHFLIKEILNLKLPQGSKVLDVGCFPPHLFQLFELLGFDVYGISSKHEPLKHKQVVSLNIETDRLPFEPNFFDLILFTETIEHLLIMPDIYMQKIYKILKKDGRLILTTPNVVHLKNRIKLLLGRNIYFSLEQLNQTDSYDRAYFRHNREFTMSELEQLLNYSRFKIEKKKFFSAYSPFRKGLNRSILEQLIKTVGFFITKLFSQLQDSLFIIARK